MQCNLLTPLPLFTDSVDLLDEQSISDIQIGQFLDMESNNYILNLSKENIQSIIGGAISDQHRVIGYKEDVIKQDANKENGVDCTKQTTVRRSSRVNQQNECKSKDLFPKRKKATKTRSKIRYKKNTKSKEKEATAKKSNTHMKKIRSNINDKHINNKQTEEKIVTDQSVGQSVRSATGIPRAAWGDMTDGPQSETDQLEYPANSEILYAVDLMTVRSALEKMQAMPDYQPRKTRSSEIYGGFEYGSKHSRK